MMKFICLMLLTLVSLNSFSERVSAQKRRIPKEPFQITDASTGKPIPEVLVIPRYYSVTGIVPSLFVKRKDVYRNYLDKPFIYRTGEPFILNVPKFNRVPLIQISVAKGRDIDGALVVAPKYRPSWIGNLWAIGGDRKIQLTPISDDEWLQLLEKKLNPLTTETVLVSDDYRFWDLPNEKFTLYIYYDNKERELVRSFLQKGSVDNK